MTEQDGRGHAITAGNALIAFSLLGLSLGAVLTAAGVVGTGFLDGPSAVGIGLCTLILGLWMRSRGAA